MVKINTKKAPLSGAFFNNFNYYAKTNNNNIRRFNMKDGLLIGLALGLIAGALIVTNNSKVEQIVQKGKKAVKKQLEKLN